MLTGNSRKTHIREYAGGPPRLFHTIGMAERMFGSSAEENLQRKLYVYRKTQQMIREHYPDVPLIFAGGISMAGGRTKM
jgi:hypothetical protein